jgi:hypothetical protein
MTATTSLSRTGFDVGDHPQTCVVDVVYPGARLLGFWQDEGERRLWATRVCTWPG